MMFVVFLFLISTVFAQKECIKSWDYFENATPQQEQQALKDGCFYGTYGSISLLSCHYEDAKFLSNQDCSTKLCVVETPRSEELLLKMTKKNTEVNRKNTNFLLKVGEAHVLSSLDGTYSCLDLEIDRAGVNVITVSDEAWRPIIPRPHSFKYNLTVPDPDIVAILNTVRPERIHQFITTLADENQFFSRQSQSQGAWDASYFLETTFRDFGFTVSRRVFRDDMSDNVVAEITGTDYPDEIIVIGAHYDSRSTNSGSTTQRAPGADDNASGTSTLLEFATIISEQGLSFRRTLRLVCFSGEEQGLIGSRAYARELADAGENVVAMFNGDMLGWKQTTQPITLGMMNRFIDPALLAEANLVTRDYVPTLPIGSTAACCSDQQSFTENGFSAIGYFENTANSVVYPHYHQSTDLPQYVNVEQLGLQGTALMAAACTWAGAYRDV
jgi:hypothetical protein